MDKTRHMTVITFKYQFAVLENLAARLPVFCKDIWLCIFQPGVVRGLIKPAFAGWAVSGFYGYLKGVKNELADKFLPNISPRNDSLAGPEGRKSDQVCLCQMLHLINPSSVCFPASMLASQNMLASLYLLMSNAKVEWQWAAKQCDPMYKEPKSSQWDPQGL